MVGKASKSALIAIMFYSMTSPAMAAHSPSYYIYDESGHVIGEYDANGNPVQEHIYLGDRPVAVVQGGASGTVDYVSTDQLNTPRVVTDQNQAVLWVWNSDPFGNEQPIGSLTYNLRFPGQYYDAETGHNYNDNRDYDASSGRYVESDPIGLHGGVNTYSYVNANPIALADPQGLVHWNGAYNYTSSGLSHFGAGAAVTGFTFVLKSECVDGKKAIVRVDALAGGGGMGVSVWGPVAIGASTVTFDDHLSSLNPNIFEGDFSYFNAGTFFGSITTFALGGAIGNGSGLNISTSAIDVSGGRGKGHLDSVQLQDCDCEKK